MQLGKKNVGIRYNEFLSNAREYAKQLKNAEFYQANLFLEIAKVSKDKKDLDFARKIGKTLNVWQSIFLLELYMFSNDKKDLNLIIEIANGINNYYVLSLGYLELFKLSNDKMDFDLACTSAEKIINILERSKIYLKLFKCSLDGSFLINARKLTNNLFDYRKCSRLLDIFEITSDELDFELLLRDIEYRDSNLKYNILLDIADSTNVSDFLDKFLILLEKLPNCFEKCRVYLKLFRIMKLKGPKYLFLKDLDYLSFTRNVLEQLSFDAYVSSFKKNLDDISLEENLEYKNKYFYEMSLIYLLLYSNSNNDSDLEKSKAFLEKISLSEEKCLIYLEYSKELYNEKNYYIDLVCEFISQIEDSNMLKSEIYLELAKLIQ